AALLAAVAPPAAADCPQAGDLRDGIRAEYADGSIVDYRSDGGGIVEIFERDGADAASGFVYRSRAGLYDLSVARIAGAGASPDAPMTYRYSDPPEALPAPAPGAAWVGTITSIPPAGGEVAETAVYVFGREEPARRIGDCSYRTISAKLSVIDGAAWIAQDFIYFADLGFAVATGWAQSGSERPVWRALAALYPLPAAE
ncbi:hypothetical protein, partial [Albidovulum sp.]